MKFSQTISKEELSYEKHNWTTKLRLVSITCKVTRKIKVNLLLNSISLLSVCFFIFLCPPFLEHRYQKIWLCTLVHGIFLFLQTLQRESTERVMWFFWDFTCFFGVRTLFFNAQCTWLSLKFSALSPVLYGFSQFYF